MMNGFGTRAGLSAHSLIVMERLTAERKTFRAAATPLWWVGRQGLFSIAAAFVGPVRGIYL